MTLKCLTLFIITLLIIRVEVQAQTGYLGRENALELRYNISPSINRSFELKDNQVVSKPVFFYSQFGFNYVLSAFKKVDLSFGYQRSQFALNLNFFYEDYTYQASFDNVTSYNEYKIVSEPSAVFNCFTFEYKLYRKANLAPLGKFFGLGFKWGILSVDKGESMELLSYGTVISSRFFKKKYNYSNHKTYEVERTESFGAFVLHLRAGQSIPISKRMVLTTQVSCPIICSFQSKYNYDIKFPIAEFGYNTEGEDIYKSNPSFRKAMQKGFIHNNLVNFDFGLRIHF